MLILHAGYYKRHFLLWGEGQVHAGPSPENVPDPVRNTPEPEHHPDDPGAKTLASILRNAGVRPASDSGEQGASHQQSSSQFPSIPSNTPDTSPEASQITTQYVVWLPSDEGTPLPSSPMIGEPPHNTENVSLAPWRTTTYTLSTSDTIALLGQCPDRHILDPGVVIGEDLKYWASALRFAGSLVAREKFLPGLQHVDGSYLALWEPVCTGADGETLAWMAENMPPAARAFSEESSDQPPETAPDDLLRSFLTWTTDWIIRTSGKQRHSKPAEEFETIHDAWLHALRAQKPTLNGKNTEIANLKSEIRAWKRPISVTQSAPWRLCFRLEEPDTDDNRGPKQVIQTSSDGWYLRYLLQPHDDPSLQIPLCDIWDNQDQVVSTLEQGQSGVRAFALAALGQVADICTVVEESLEAKHPGGKELSASEAYRFLSNDAPVLQQAGYGVFLPEWWTSRGTHTQLTAQATARSSELQGSGMLRLDSVVEFDWKLVIGDYQLNLEELEQLAQLKVPLIKIRGQWVEVDPQQIQTAIQFWHDSQNQTGTVQELMEMTVGAAAPATDIEADTIQTEGQLDELIKKLQDPDQFSEIDVPDAFQGELRPYQLRGYSWLNFIRRWGLGGCLADDMGLGKTVQTLALIQHDWQDGLQQPTLVICPTSVVNNWKREARNFTPELPVHIHHGSNRQKQQDFRSEANSNAIIISSYGVLHRDIDFLQDVSWAGVILDEAQNIKNPETKRAKAAYKLHGNYRLALTGTPVQNHVGDLWSIMEFLNPGLLGTRADFRQDFMLPIQSGSSPRTAEKLRRITRPFILRREKTDASIISDLPEKMEMKVYCNLTDEQASLYAAVLEDMNRGLNNAVGIQRDGIVFAALSKLKQICNHPAQFLSDNSPLPARSGKLECLTNMLREMLEMKDCALIFTQFRMMGEMLKTHIQNTFGREALFLHGGVPQRRRTQMVDRFQSTDENIPAFILSLKAAGTGLNLTAANHVVHYDRWWNPAVENQATDRAFRIGQDQNVEVHKFICAGTVEEHIDDMIEQKKEIADEVIGSGQSWLSDLSNDQLRDVFELRCDAVGE